MADDTATVEQAKRALLDAIKSLEPDGFVQEAAIDALIAAVRADSASHSTETPSSVKDAREQLYEAIRRYGDARANDAGLSDPCVPYAVDWINAQIDHLKALKPLPPIMVTTPDPAQAITPETDYHAFAKAIIASLEMAEFLQPLAHGSRLAAIQAVERTLRHV